MSATLAVAQPAGATVDIGELIAQHLRARSLELSLSRSARRHLAGAHLSRFRGRGMDYAESRAYLPGDDMRSMDWRVTARSGRPHTKVYQEERERPVLVTVDFSASMFFGTQVAFKSVVAAHAAALLAWTAMRGGDRIGAMVFHGDEHSEVRPAAGRRGALRVLRAVAELADPQHEGSETQWNLADILPRIRRVARPGGLICLLSDFYTLDDACEHHVRELRTHNDMMMCWIHDPLEAKPPPPGRYPVSDGQRVAVLDTTGGAEHAAYTRSFEQRAERLGTLCAALRIPLISLATNDDVHAVLQRTLSKPRGVR